MIAERYIMREIMKPAAVICFVLVFIYGSFMAARYWASAAQGQIPGSTVMILVFFRIAVAMEILLPTTLYLSVVLALSRLYMDGEITAMSACGISPFRVTRAVFLTALLTALLVACFSLFIRPWAWGQFYSMKARAKASFDLSRMKGGVFYQIWHGRRVIFAEKVNSGRNRAENIFIQTRRDDAIQVIQARHARQYYDPQTSMPVLILFKGRDYEFSSSGDKEMVLQFDQLELSLEPRDIMTEQRVKATPTRSLLGSGDLRETAELQWRLVSPVSTLLLALLAVPLSRSSPRQGKYTRIPLAILIFAAYYNLSAIVKKWVAQGVIGPFPGLWWSQILLLVLIILLFSQPEISVLWQRRRAG